MRKNIAALTKIPGINDCFTKELQPKVFGYKHGKLIWSSVGAFSTKRKKEYKRIAKKSTRNFIKRTVLEEVRTADFIYKGK